MQLSHVETKTIPQEVEVIDGTICNICGEPIGMYEEIGIPCEHVHIHQSFGYCSHHDTETHDLDICEECYDKLLASCKIKPTVETYM